MSTAVRWNLMAIVLFIVLIYLQYRLWFESGGIQDMIKLKNALAMQKIETEKLKQRNDDLLFQIQRLQNSHDATESRARNELGMIKKGETFYQIVKKGKEHEDFN